MAEPSLDKLTSTWPPVPKVVDTDYRVMYIPAGMSLPNMHAPITNDMYIHLHLSGIAVLGLARGHPILAEGRQVSTLNWSVSQNTDANKGAIKMSGKRKRGAPKLYANSNICEIKCADGTNWMLKSVIKAKLVEVNARALLTNNDPVPEPVLESDDPKKKEKNKDVKHGESLPWTQPLPAPGTPYAPPLLHTDADFSGFLCLLLVTPSQINFILNRLLNENDYTELLRQRAAHDGEVVTFRLCDLRPTPNGPYQDVYAATMTNGGVTWGKGVYTPPKVERAEESTEDDAIVAVAAASLSDAASDIPVCAVAAGEQAPGETLLDTPVAMADTTSRVSCKRQRSESGDDDQ